MTRKREQTSTATSQRDLARQLQVSRSTVNRLCRDGLKPDRSGLYSLKEAQELQRVRVLRMREHAAEGKQRRAAERRPAPRRS